MKKRILFAAFAACLLAGCDNDDLEKRVDSLENRLEIVEKTLTEINSGISSLQSIVEALQNGKSVSNVEETATGYVITFSDGSNITLKHGQDGANGQNATAPVIGMAESEGAYYWTVTIDGETQFMENNGKKVPVTGNTPKMGVDENGYWTVDTGNGPEWVKDEDGNPIPARTGATGSFISDVVYTDKSIKFIFSDGTTITLPKDLGPKADDKAQPKVEAKGFYIVNEGWYGHDKGSVNYFEKNGTSYTPRYRAFKAANPDTELGNTTCYGAIWGDNFYLISKQDNRLVIADAQNLKSKKVITDLGGDGRSFLGIDDQKAYIGYNGGIKTFNIESLTLGEAIAGVSGEIGNMCYAYGKVFAVSDENLYIIDAKTDKVEKTVTGSYDTYKSVVTAKDGSVWVATVNKFIVYNPNDLENTKEIAYPVDAAVSSSWGSWNPGGLCASTQTNTLYWTTGTSPYSKNAVCKYDIDASNANSSFYTLPNDEAGQKRVLYGAGLRVDPLSDNLVLQSCRDGWGDSFAYNWLFLLSNTGKLNTSFVVADKKVHEPNGSTSFGNGYYWFPSMPVFEDANKPQILLNQVMMGTKKKVKIDLSTKVVDYDNIFATMATQVELLNKQDQAKVSIAGNKLVIESQTQEGNFKLKLTVVSNGVKVEKEIELVIANEK